MKTSRSHFSQSICLAWPVHISRVANYPVCRVTTAICRTTEALHTLKPYLSPIRSCSQASMEHSNWPYNDRWLHHEPYPFSSTKHNHPNRRLHPLEHIFKLTFVYMDSESSKAIDSTLPTNVKYQNIFHRWGQRWCTGFSRTCLMRRFWGGNL